MSRKLIDWSFIKPLYCAGGLSNVEIVRQYNDAHKDQDQWKSTVAESAIRKQAKLKAWKKDIADQVKRKAREKLVRERCDSRTDEEIIDQAADTIAQVIQLHRKDINNLKALEADLIRRLSEDETQIELIKWQGEATEKEIKLGLIDRTTVYHKLVAAISQRIKLERLAWGIDDENGDPDQPDRVILEQHF